MKDGILLRQFVVILTFSLVCFGGYGTAPDDTKSHISSGEFVYNDVERFGVSTPASTIKLNSII